MCVHVGFDVECMPVVGVGEDIDPSLGQCGVSVDVGVLEQGMCEGEYMFNQIYKYPDKKGTPHKIGATNHFSPAAKMAAEAAGTALALLGNTWVHMT